MSERAEKARRRRPRTVESVAPALVLLAQGHYASQVAKAVGVSAATVLNWMDWAWKHRQELDVYLREHYPDLSEGQIASLWQRIARRRFKRQRRLDFQSLLSPD
ncbi:MAG: hypothetical protein H5T68_10425 [Chloroflexi bacterium]|nr:hypothetical protein [Chloroflexota bacterium]